MSVRGQTTDYAVIAATWGVDNTESFTIGLWYKPKSVVTVNDIFIASAGVLDPSTPFMGLAAPDNSGSAGLFLYNNTLSPTSPYDLTTDTWYYLVLGRNGGVGTDYILRVFDDSTSTTPLTTVTLDDTGIATASFTHMAIGVVWTGEDVDAEFECWRVHENVYWTDAQARTESQNYTPQTGGGAIFGNWKLKTTNADADGMNDSGGAGNHLTNNGFANGASTPTQLGGGGGGQTMTPSAIPSTDTVVVAFSNLRQPLTPSNIPAAATDVTSASLLLSTQFMTPSAIPSVSTSVDTVAIALGIAAEQVGTHAPSATLLSGAQFITPSAIPSVGTAVPAIVGIIVTISPTTVGTGVTAAFLTQPLTPQNIPQAVTDFVNTSRLIGGALSPRALINPQYRSATLGL